MIAPLSRRGLVGVAGDSQASPEGGTGWPLRSIYFSKLPIRLRASMDRSTRPVKARMLPIRRPWSCCRPDLGLSNVSTVGSVSAGAGAGKSHFEALKITMLFLSTTR